MSELDGVQVWLVSNRMRMCAVIGVIHNLAKLCHTTQLTVELNMHLDSKFSTKTFLWELHMVSIHGWTAIAKHLVTHANAKCWF